MRLRDAVTATIKNKRFWLWELTGIIIYSIPVAIRFATRSVSIPILNFPGFWIGHFIPGNFLEKLLVNAFFPGGAGGIAGETLVSNYKGQPITGKTEYLSRLAGAMLQTAAWSAFQYVGYSLLIIGPYGGNIFEHAVVFPINFTLAAFSIFTPTILDFLKSKLTNIPKTSDRPQKETSLRILQLDIAYPIPTKSIPKRIRIRVTQFQPFEKCGPVPKKVGNEKYSLVSL